MKPVQLATTLSLLILAGSHAQNVPPAPEEDPVQKAIQEFNRRDSRKPNEVTVVLPPANESAEKKQPDHPNKEAVLVTGKAPDETQLIDEASNETSETKEQPHVVEEPVKPAIQEETPQPKRGLAVRVEKLQHQGQNLDGSAVKLRAPFPAKPLAEAPTGWKIESSEHAPPFNRDIELAPGKTITLTVRPHVLVPEADGATSFEIAEPGFEPSLGYDQATTVSSILSQSVRQLENDSRELGAAIDTLQQILVTLPKPATVPQENTP